MCIVTLLIGIFTNKFVSFIILFQTRPLPHTLWHFDTLKCTLFFLFLSLISLSARKLWWSDKDNTLRIWETWEDSLHLVAYDIESEGLCNRALQSILSLVRERVCVCMKDCLFWPPKTHSVCVIYQYLSNFDWGKLRLVDTGSKGNAQSPKHLLFQEMVVF